MTRKNRRTMDFIETLKDGDEIKLADAIAWADKTMIEKACEVLNDLTENRLGDAFLKDFRKRLEE